jgi:predicted dehydrogenase
LISHYRNGVFARSGNRNIVLMCWNGMPGGIGMNEGRVGVGIIGLGLISRAHIRGYQEAESDARIVAVCDSNEARVDAVSKNLGARPYTRHSDLLRDPEVQLVDITLPHNLHYQIAKDAINAHRHVIVEKPMTAKAEESRELIQFSSAAGVKFTVAENTPFVAAYREVEKLIQRHVIGTPRLIRTLIYGSEVERLRDVTSWKGRTAGSCGGVIIDAGAHSFYLLKWLFGEIATVQATSAKLIEESEVEDHAIVTGRMKSGAIFSTEYTFTAEIPWGERLEVYGSTGSLIVDQLCNPPAVHFRDKTDTTGTPIETVPYDPKGWKATSIVGGVRDFIGAVKNGRPPRVDASDGHYVLLVAEKAYESIAQSGKPVAVWRNAV